MCFRDIRSANASFVDDYMSSSQSRIWYSLEVFKSAMLCSLRNRQSQSKVIVEWTVPCLCIF